MPLIVISEGILPLAYYCIWSYLYFPRLSCPTFYGCKCLRIIKVNKDTGVVIMRKDCPRFMAAIRVVGVRKDL